MANLSNINNILRTGSLGVGINRDPAGPFEVSSATKAGIKMFNTAASGKTYQAYSDVSGNYIIYDVAADSNRLVISSGGNATFAGNVNIGSSLSSEKLEVGGTIRIRVANSSSASLLLNNTDTQLSIENTAGNMIFTTAGAAEKLRISSGGNATFAGNVGIGTDPAQRLHVEGSNHFVTFSNPSTTANHYAQVLLKAGDRSNFIWTANQNSTNWGGAGSLNIYTNESGSSIAFFTQGDATNTKLMIKADGNVGIGNNLPGAKLVVGANVNSNASGIEVNAGAGGGNVLSNGTADNWFPYVDNNNYYSAQDHIFRSETNSSTRMTIKSSGNVGIGVPSPGRELDVLGVIRAQGTFHSIVSSTSTNLATDNGGSLNLFNSSSTDGNFNNIGGYNSNSLVTSQICFINESHTNRTGAIAFLTHNGSNMPERMRIDSYGNVRIGTGGLANSHSKLDVIGGPYAFLALQATDTGGRRWELFSYATTESFHIYDRTNDQYRFTIDETGRVGIGTNSPKGKLDVFRAAGQSATCAIAITNGEANNRSWGLSSEVRKAGDFAILCSPSANTAPTPTDDNIRLYFQSGGDISLAMEDYNANPSAINYGLQLETGATGKSYWQSAVNAATSHYHYEFINTNGSVGTIRTLNSATSYVTNSDYRLKEDLQDFNGLDKVSKIPVYNFKWKIDDTRSYGVMAHELDVVLPDAVSGEKDDVNEDKSINPQGVDYSKIVPLLVKSIQELEARLKILENK